MDLATIDKIIRHQSHLSRQFIETLDVLPSLERERKGSKDDAEIEQETGDPNGQLPPFRIDPAETVCDNPTLPSPELETCPQSAPAK